MKLFVMRHGEAAPQQASKILGGQTYNSDAERELTARGEREVEASTQWLREHYAEIDLAITSTLVRAQQTLDIVQTGIPLKQIEVSAEVTPSSDPEVFASALLARLQIEPAATVLVVSHMPFVCYLVSYLDAKVQAPLFPTAGIAVLDVDPLEMAGRLRSMTAPPEC
ncbi:phosphohistidine phosphatase SixA [Aliidiomarina minuta]|uniref:phosphoglycerate mutase (2,3-diphosphoglycerate-dependent) n=1 Tax=Aliidiomarina minuta TaxID=880057 RepID=A0A432W5K6_9GAMM|nr:phosphohistidine phosphatase SixA [Aliidiomarina minuta]RUO25354.1 phosphohistidine phosphatase SixA [Aliidiomarina minuta]